MPKQKKRGRARKRAARRDSQPVVGMALVEDPSAPLLEPEERAVAIDWFMGAFAPVFERAVEAGRRFGAEMVTAAGLLGEVRRVSPELLRPDQDPAIRRRP